MLDRILRTMKNAGLSAYNIAFGSGGGLLQKLNHQPQKFAFKCSSATVGDEERDVFKQLITDSGKRSKTGRLKLVYSQGFWGNDDCFCLGPTGRSVAIRVSHR